MTTPFNSHESGSPNLVVIAGLDPAIHSVTLHGIRERCAMDARIKSGHDDI
jgi:hypothetical protein